MSKTTLFETHPQYTTYAPQTAELLSAITGVDDNDDRPTTTVWGIAESAHGRAKELDPLSADRQGTVPVGLRLSCRCIGNY